MRGLSACTCVAGNYVAFARVLADSFHHFHPGIPLHILVADKQDPRSLFQNADVRVVGLQDLCIPDLWKMLLRYDRKQVVVAAKPALLRYVLESGYQSAVYLDADMLVTASLDPLLQVVANHSLTLTPHIGPAFATAGRAEMETNLLFAGMYNGGLVGVSNREESRRFLSWWEGRLRTHCIEAVRQGLCYDQRWLDLAPALIADLHLLRDSGCNVAYWNLPDLDVRLSGADLLVDNSPVCLFHFSGFNPSQPELASVHAPGLRTVEMGPVAPLFRRYAVLLNEAGWAETSKKKWPWDRWRAVFRKGVFNVARLRRLLRKVLAVL